MRRYETPELLQVGAVHNVVLGTKNTISPDNPNTSPANQLQALSILDVDVE